MTLLLLSALALLGIAILRRRRRRRPEPDLSSCVEAVLVGVQAGLTIPAALDSATQWSPSEVADALTRVGRGFSAGDPPRLALAPLSGLPGGAELAASLERALDDGLPVADLLATLLATARASRRRSAEARISALPARLSLPVVTCVLPSFLLLGVLPLVVALGPAVHSGAP